MHSLSSVSQSILFETDQITREHTVIERIMMKKGQILIKKASFQFCLIAGIITAIVWGIFFAQGAFSDIVTFGKGGDAGRQTYPAFIQLGYLIKNHISNGIDITITNGSNSIYSDGLAWYFVYRIFACLGALSGRPLVFYVLFFSMHMFINMYFTAKLCFENFGVNKKVSILVAVSAGASSLFNAWFTSFFVIYSLVLPLFYILINTVRSRNFLMAYFVPSAAYVIALNTGYSTVSCFLAGVLFVVAFYYNYMTYKEIGLKCLIYRSLIPGFIGAIVCFPSLWWTYISMKSSDGTDLWSALYYDLDISSLPSFFFFSYNAIAAESGYFTFGLVWLFLTLVIILTQSEKKLEIRDRIFFKSIIILNILLIFVCMGKSFPFGKWFYEIPIFGLMHLRMRYLLVTLPFFYVFVGCAAKKIDFKENKKTAYTITGVFAGILLTIMIIFWRNFDKSYLLLELALAIVVIYYLFVENINSIKVIVLGSCYILAFHTNKLYAVTNASSHSNDFVYASIAYNKDFQNALDDYVSGLEQQGIYKYIEIEAEDAVPYFIMNNYGWYHYQQYDLCNYLRYPLHGGAINTDYADNIRVSYFDEFNWEYLFDTRADFVVLSQGVVNEKSEFYYNQVMDNSYLTYLSNDYFAAKVKKYIPRHYTGGDRILDISQTFDNGYFYSPYLRNDEIVKFETDKASYFRLELASKQAGDIQFSLNPSSSYKYFLDGKEIEPMIDYGLVYFPVSEGNHVIEVRYHNALTNAIRYIYDAYYSFLLIVLIYIGFVSIKNHN